MFKIFSLLILLSMNSFAFTERGVLEGDCKIFQENEKVSVFNFKLNSGENSVSSEKLVVAVPIEGANPDIYNVVAINNAGVEESWRKGIWLYVERMRVLCDPPIMLPNGEVSITPCSRPNGWEFLEGISGLKNPKDGEVISFKTVSHQAAISCKGTFSTY